MIYWRELTMKLSVIFVYSPIDKKVFFSKWSRLKRGLDFVHSESHVKRRFMDHRSVYSTVEYWHLFLVRIGISQADATWSKIILINMPIYMYIYNLLKFTQRRLVLQLKNIRLLQYWHASRAYLENLVLAAFHFSI